MIRLKAKPVTRGLAEGEALVSRMAISFTGGMDPESGIIREPGHDLYGQSVAGKILVFPTGKGSTTGSWQYYAAFKRGFAPKGIINEKAEGVVAVSAIVTPTGDPFTLAAMVLPHSQSPRCRQGRRPREWNAGSFTGRSGCRAGARGSSHD